MMRRRFDNTDPHNQLILGKEGDRLDRPSAQWRSDLMRVFDAVQRYKQEGVPLLVLAGKEYGNGSSRDWAAKGPMMLGVRAVIAESYERIRRSNLIGMGVLPLQFRAGESAASLLLTGRQEYDILGIAEGLRPGQGTTVRVRRSDDGSFLFGTLARIDLPGEVEEYYRNGDVLNLMLRRLLEKQSGQQSVV